MLNLFVLVIAPRESETNAINRAKNGAIRIRKNASQNSISKLKRSQLMVSGYCFSFARCGFKELVDIAQI
jgi:hypothetical protein